MNKGTAIFGVILAFVVGFFIGKYTGNGSHAAVAEGGGGADISNTPYAGAGVPAAPTGERFKVFPGNAPYTGAANPKVVIIEYSDFQCPFCGRAKKTVDQILQTYPDVRLYYKENPLPMHPNAKPAAEAAMAAFQQGPQYFWKLYNKFFDDQEDLSPDNIKQWAQDSGLDMTKYSAALAAGSPSLQQIDAAITADQTEASNWGLQGTPMFLIDGRPVRGAVPFQADQPGQPDFKSVIDSELDAANKDLAAGVPQNQLYATLLANATATPPAGGAGAGQQQKPAVAEADANALYNVPITGAPARGAKQPKIVVAEWSDFQCPFCQRVEPTLKDLMTQYPDLEVVWHNYPLPFHPNAMPDAEAAYAAGAQGKFWEFHDLLYANQGTQDRTHYDQWAGQLGLDVKQFDADLDSHKYQPQIQADSQLGSKFGVQGTPAFFINGKYLSGAQPIDAFKTIIDAQEKVAAAKLAAGTPIDGLYAALVSGGLDHANVQAQPQGPQGPQPAQPDPNQVYKIELGSAPQLGPADAKVTLVLFSDFQCPFCGRLEPTLAALRAKYPSDLRIVWKQFPLPFHPNAGPAAEVAAEANAEGKFWAVHDELFKQQANLDRTHLMQIAADNGLDATKVGAAIDSKTYDAQIQADIKQGQQFGVQGTPSFFINGKFVVGALPVEQLQPKIDQAITDANAMIAKGTPQASLYDTLMKTAQTTLPAPSAAPGAPPANNTIYKIDPGTSYAQGPLTAPVTVIEFSDFQCPFCSRVEPTVKQIMSTYGPKVRFVWKNYPLPFHPNAMPDAEAAEAAGAQGKFWEFHDLLFANQGTQDRTHYDQWATQLGLNMTQFDADLDSKKYDTVINAEKAVGDANGTTGTPTFYIDGHQIVGAQDFSAFQTVIDAELKAKGM
jgi:protein-disulfide isomerase